MISSSSPDLRVAVLGNVDSGKSTLVGVLSRGVADDGRGSARAHVLQHPHERDKGQTSSVAIALLGYDAHDQPVEHPPHHHHLHLHYSIASRAAHLTAIIDLCGHEHFLHTTVFGLTALAPDCVLLVVGANAGVQKMTREHLGLAVALDLPVAVVVTKTDVAPQHVLADTLRRVDRIVRLAQRKRFNVLGEQDCTAAAAALDGGSSIVPVFQVSCTEGGGGGGLLLLRRFLQLLACRTSLPGQGIRNQLQLQELEKPETDSSSLCEMHIDNTYNVPGVGIVVGGSVFRGCLRVGSKLVLGPDAHGQFKEVRALSVHRHCVPVEQCFVGQQCTVAIKLNKSTGPPRMRKGLVLLGAKRAQQLWGGARMAGVPATVVSASGAVACFEAAVRILHHSTTIKTGYSPIVHLGTVRQSAMIEAIITPQHDEPADEALRTGSVAVVRFRFLYRPEFVTVGRSLVFREGTTKGVGRVVALVA